MERAHILAVFMVIAVGVFFFAPVGYDSFIQHLSAYNPSLVKVRSWESLSCAVFGEGTVFTMGNSYNGLVYGRVYRMSYQIGCAPKPTPIPPTEN